MATAKDKITYDVFICHTWGDAEIASAVSNALLLSNLEPFWDSGLGSGETFEGVIWEALSESRAMLAIFSKTSPTPTPSMALEIGAAKAWNKPIYGIVSDASIQVPKPFNDIPFFTLGRVDEIILDLKRNKESLADQEISYLLQVFMNVGIPVDRLASEPWALSLISERFKKLAKRTVPSERLLWTLMRLRKEGVLSAPGKNLSHGIFELKTTASGRFHFVVKAGNGEIILASQQYEAKAGALNGIESVRTNARLDERFERKISKADEPFFVLKAANGQVIGQSEMYSSRFGMENGIESVKKNAPDAKLKDLS